MDTNPNFHEFVLNFRPGFHRLTLVLQFNIIQVYNYIKKARKEERQRAFQIPDFLQEAGQDVSKFSNVRESEKFIIDLRTEEEKKLVRENKSVYTLNNKINIWEVQPEIINQQKSKVNFKPSLHNLVKEEHILAILGAKNVRASQA